MILLRWYKMPQLIKSNPYASIAAGALFLISIFHFSSMSDYRFGNICSSLIWISCPLAVYFNADKFKVLAAPYFSFLWIIDCLQSLWQICRKAELIGLPGNRNWHGAFLLATTPFMIYYLYSGLKKKNLPPKIVIVISLIPAVISLIFLYFCHSRGALSALIITGLIAFALYFPHLKKDVFWRIIIYGIILLSLSFLFAGNRIADIIFQDIRIPLWHGALKMTVDYPLTGVSTAGYESSYAPYRPIAYFLKSRHFAVRANHPHNHLLYIAGVFGIPGATAWFYLWIIPILILYRKYHSLGNAAKLYFFSYITLCIHSMLDLIFFEWPTLFISCLLLGMIWRETWTSSTEKTPTMNTETDMNPPLNSYDIPSNKKFLCQKVLLVLTGISLVSFIGNMMMRDMLFSYHMRNSWVYLKYEQPYNALTSINKALSYKDDYVYSYRAGQISFERFHDHLLALSYYRNQKKSFNQNFAYNNRHIAECLLIAGKKYEALDYRKKAVEISPISIIDLYYKLLLENNLGLKGEAETTAGSLISALKYKGLTVEDIPAILNNPHYDSKFDLLDKGDGDVKTLWSNG